MHALINPLPAADLRRQPYSIKNTLPENIVFNRCDILEDYFSGRY